MISWILSAALVASAIQDASRLPLPPVTLSAKDFAKPAEAPSPATPAGFTGALTAAANKCAALGYRANMERQMDSGSQAASSAQAAVTTCVTNARHAGADAYKQFASGSAGAPIKASAKDLLAAWLAYLPAWSNGTRGTMEEAEYKKAYSRFDVETMTQ